MTKSHELEEQELKADLRDGIISKEEFDRRLKELKSYNRKRVKDESSEF